MPDEKTVGRHEYETAKAKWLDHISDVLDSEFDDIATFKPSEIVDIDFEEGAWTNIVGIRMDNNFGIVPANEAVAFAKALLVAASVASKFEYMGHKVVDEQDDMRDLDHMMLPTDADGVPIRVGDVMVGDDLYKLNVVGLYENGFVWQDESGNMFSAHAADYRHYAESWESIIFDAEVVGRGWYDTKSSMGADRHAELIDQLVSRCKALAEGGE